MSIDFNNFIIIICFYLWYCPTISFRASIVSPAHTAIHCGLFLVPGYLEAAITTLLDAFPMRPEIFIEICGHWMMRLSLTRSGGMSRRPAGVLPATFTIFVGNKSHQFLIMNEDLL